jgi:hypothetical protein
MILTDEVIGENRVRREQDSSKRRFNGEQDASGRGAKGQRETIERGSEPTEGEVCAEQDAVGDEGEKGEVAPAGKQESGHEDGGGSEGDAGVPARDPLVDGEFEREEVVPGSFRREMKRQG